MTSIETALGAIQIPLWVAAIGAVALMVLVVTLVRVLTFRNLIGTIPRILLFGLIAIGVYFGIRHYEDSVRQHAERRALDDRYAALFTQTIQPGSVFACIDGSPQPAMFEACERALFAEPQVVAAAVAVVSQRITLLADGLNFAATRELSYADRMESLRIAAEADPYGFVAYVLATEDKCTVERCPRFRLLRDDTRVKENMRARRFEAFMIKHAAGWREPGKQPVGEVRPPAMPGEAVVVPGVAIGERVPEIQLIEPNRLGVIDPSRPSNIEPARPNAVEASRPGNTQPASAPAPAPAPAAASATTSTAGTPAPESPFDPPPGHDTAPAAPAVVPAMPRSRPADLPSQRPQTPAAGAAGKQSAPARPASSPSAAQRKQKEPVAGLPRVVPSDYVRDEPEPAHSQASGQTGAPTSLTPPPPQQNLFDR